MMATTDAREVLADLMLDVIVFAELGTEDEINPDTAVRLLEDTIAALHRLGASDRLWLHDHVQAAARAEPDPERRRVLERLSHALIEEDE